MAHFRQTGLMIGWDLCLAGNNPAHLTSPYRRALEVVALVKAAVIEATGLMVESVRTLESGVVEEHAVVILAQGEKSLLFRMWPIFFTDDKRVEYTILTNREPIQELILAHVGLFAKANGARLVEKKHGLG